MHVIIFHLVLPMVAGDKVVEMIRPRASVFSYRIVLLYEPLPSTVGWFEHLKPVRTINSVRHYITSRALKYN